MAPETEPRCDTPMHAVALELVDLIGMEACWEVAQWIRRQGAAQRLYLDDYLIDVLTVLAASPSSTTESGE